MVKAYLVGTYDNPGYASLQFMLSSPYTNYANGSGTIPYVVSLNGREGPGGNAPITGTNSSNENYYQ